MRRDLLLAVLLAAALSSPAAAAPPGIVPYIPPAPREASELCFQGQCNITDPNGLYRQADKVAAGPDGALWFPLTSSSAGTDAVPRNVRFDPRTSRFTELLPPAGSTFTTQIAPGPDGNLWLADHYLEEGSTFSLARLVRLEPASGRYTSFPIPSLAHPILSYGSIVTTINTGPDGRLWFVDWGARHVGRFDLATGEIAQFPVPSLQSARGLVVGPDGNLWFVDRLANTVHRITPAGQATEFPISAELGEPMCVAAGPDGALWVCTTRGLIRDPLSPTSVVPLGAGSTFIPLYYDGAWDMALGTDGFMWFAYRGFHAVGRISPAGLELEAFPIDGTDSPAPKSIVAGPDGNLWLWDDGIRQLVQVSHLSVHPASGPLLSTQVIDVTVVNHRTGPALVGGQALLDGLDVTDLFVGCAVVGGLAEGGLAARCPGIPAGLLGLGAHTFEVRLDLSDGTALRQASTWTILDTVEPPDPGHGLGPAGELPSLVVMPPPGPLLSNEAYAFAVAIFPAGRSIVRVDTDYQAQFRGYIPPLPPPPCRTGSLRQGGMTLRCDPVPVSLLMQIQDQEPLGDPINLYRVVEVELDDGTVLLAVPHTRAFPVGAP